MHSVLVGLAWKKIMRLKAISALIIFILIAGIAAAQKEGKKTVLENYKEDEILVRFKEGVSKEEIQSIHAKFSPQVKSRGYKSVKNLQKIKLPPGLPVKEALELYRNNPNVLYAEPNYFVEAFAMPNDADFTELWGLHNIGQAGGTADADIDAPEAWNITTGNSSVVIVVIDTGINYTHPDLLANMWRNTAECSGTPGADDDGNGYTDDCYGIDTANNDADPMDDNNHGTHVAGTIGAVGNNSIGVVGVNWNISIMACKFLNDAGSGTVSDAIDCLNYTALMKDNGTNIIATSNSWGGGSFSQALSDAIDAQRQRGILFIAAAGNANSDNDITPLYPASYYLPNIVAVASTTRTDARSSFSNYGRGTVHVGAPGSEILSSVKNGSYGVFSGTSMATPHVTGLAALLKAQNSSRDWKALKNLVLAGGDDISSLQGITLTGKRINAYSSLTCSNSTVLSWLRPTGSTTTVEIGSPLNLSAIHVNCSNPNGDVNVTVSPGGEIITLLDDGNNSDQVASDGIYSGQWTPQISSNYTLALPNEDEINVSVLLNYNYSSTTFNWRNISGTNLSLTDDAVAQLTPPFPINLGGATFETMYISMNGVISFTENYITLSNSQIPSSSYNTLIAPFWDDLYPGSSGNNVFWDVTGTAPNQELVIEWRNVLHYNCRSDSSAVVRFQAVFFENSSNIFFNYMDTAFGGGCSSADKGGSATAGIQISRNRATQYSYNAQNLDNSSALIWWIDTIPPSIAIASPANTTTYNSSSVELNFTAEDNVAISWVGYSLDGAGNVTITGNTTVNLTKTGQHFLELYVMDLAGNLNSSSVYFTINYSFPVKNINKNQNYTIIQQAINEASENDTITVDNGTYNENIDINKAINLVGAGADVTIINATNSSDHVINVSNVNNVNISRVTVKGARGCCLPYSGIYMYSSNYSKIEYINASNNEFGIYLSYSNNGTLTNINTSSNAETGITLIGSNGCSLTNNNASSNYVGIFLSSSTNNNLVNITASSNEKGGILLYYSSNYNVLTNNTANSNIYDGIVLYSSNEYNTLTNNTVSSNIVRGILISSSNNNSLINNTGTLNGYGVYVRTSNNNSIYHNNFINNLIQQASDDGNNTWDSGYPSSGNYWSDFDNASEGCADANNDAVCDSAYNISGGTNKDRYPVLTQNGWLNVVQDVFASNITITSPQNKSYNSSRLSLNFSLSSDVMGWIGYSLNGSANVMVGGNTTFNASEGYHNLTLYVNDSLGNLNSSTVYFTADLSAPLINGVEISPSPPGVNTLVNITVNATDKTTSISAVILNITYPNKTSAIFTALQNSSSSSLFNYSNFNVSQYGIYNLTVLVNDTAGNANSTKARFAAVKKNETVKEIKNGTNETVYKDDDVEIIIFVNETGNATTVNVSIDISRLASSFSLVHEINSSLSNSKADKGLKYINLTNATSLENLTKIRLKLFYSDSETSENSLDEDKYAVYYWDGSAWIKLSDYINSTVPNGPFVFDAGVDKESNFAYADINHFSIYGLGGAVKSDNSNNGGNGGGGGGGGGGISDLLHLNRWWEICFGDCLIVYGRNAAKEDIETANMLLEELKERLIQWGSSTVRTRVNRGDIKVYNESELSELYLTTNHLILIGGDYANAITAKVNKTNTFERAEGMRWKINANNTGQIESENGATMEFASSPYSPYRKALIIAGNTRKGTVKAGGYLIARLVGDESISTLE